MTRKHPMTGAEGVPYPPPLIGDLAVVEFGDGGGELALTDVELLSRSVRLTTTPARQYTVSQGSLRDAGARCLVRSIRRERPVRRSRSPRCRMEGRRGGTWSWDTSVIGVAPWSARAPFPGPSPAPCQTATRQYRPFIASVAPDQVPPAPWSAATATVTSERAYMSLLRPIALPTENPEFGA